MRRLLPLLAPLLLACTATAPAPPPPPSSSPPAPIAAPSPPPSSPPTASAAPLAPPAPALDVAAILFPDAATTPASAARCASIAITDGKERARCLFGARYERDPEALRLAVDLFETSGDVAGVQVEQEMEGGFRGKIHLVPEPPVGPYRKHLGYITFARRDVDAFFAALAARARAPIRYEHGPLAFRFFRSVGRTTPSAYAEGFTVSYNVSGSLHGSAEMVRDTIFHEVFHLNDAAHDGWSGRALRSLYDAIVQRCGTRAACLRPYAPGDTMVRGGTYYAFQPDNGDPVHEYAAELALRYFREQRAAFAGQSRPELRGPAAPGWFKCGPDENRRAWEAIAAEFFGGVDDTPACR